MSTQTKTDTLIRVENLKVFFPVLGGVLRHVVGHVRAVNDVSFDLKNGEILSVVGESGCGKSTLGYATLGLVPPTDGNIEFHGEKLNVKKISSWKPFRKEFQIIFQDPYSSLNPRHTIYEILSEPMIYHGIETRKTAKDAVAELLNKVQLQPDYMFRYPHAFSGGQRQRLGIARAISLKPRAIICDEIVAALDVSVQAQIIHLLLKLKEEMGLALLFISHDLSLVKTISDRINVMYLGRIVEAGSSKEIFSNPKHPYTKALLESIPTLDLSKKPKLLAGEVPSPINLPKGCAFHTRCVHAKEDCKADPFPSLETFPGGRKVACHYPF